MKLEKKEYKLILLVTKGDVLVKGKKTASYLSLVHQYFSPGISGMFFEKKNSFILTQCKSIASLQV